MGVFARNGIPRSGILIGLPKRNLVASQPNDRRRIFPKLGSKSAAIIADLKHAQLNSAQIAEKHQCTAANVSKVRRRAIERGIIEQPEDQYLVSFGGWQRRPEMHALRLEAKVRNTEVFDLIRLIITIVAKENLFDAVLGEPEERQKIRKRVLVPLVP
jgi:hypothetical protein